MPERASSGLSVSGKVRLARPADIESLVEIDGLANASPWSPAQFAAVFGTAAESTESALVLEEQGRISGFIIFSRVLDEACIHNLAVRPARQGGGLGRRLVSAALEVMKCNGARRCLLEVRESNAAARALYEALCFQLDGNRKNYYPASPGREDALLMSRQL